MPFAVARRREASLKTLRARSIRSAAAAGVLVLVACLSASTRIEPSPFARSVDVTVIYIGADDCVPCRIWRRQHWPGFEASSEFGRLRYREVMSPKLLDLLADQHWPQELREHRDRLDRAAGVPLWLLLADGQLVLEARGLGQWKHAALPAIKRLLR
jgi:hypothetical protein